MLNLVSSHLSKLFLESSYAGPWTSGPWFRFGRWYSNDTYFKVTSLMQYLHMSRRRRRLLSGNELRQNGFLGLHAIPTNYIHIFLNHPSPPP